MAKPRVHELAKEFGVTSKEVIAKLGEMNEFVKGPSSTLNPKPCWTMPTCCLTKNNAAQPYKKLNSQDLHGKLTSLKNFIIS